LKFVQSYKSIGAKLFAGYNFIGENGFLLIWEMWKLVNWGDLDTWHLDKITVKVLHLRISPLETVFWIQILTIVPNNKVISWKLLP
jgi:hypothetical protein